MLWGEIGSIVHRYPELFAEDTVTTLNIVRHAQSYITGVTIPSSGTSAQREAKFSGKHAPHLLFIIDEGDAVPDEVYRGIESCMSGGDARLLVLFNPREEMGPVYRMERDKRANIVSLSAFNHPNVVTGENIIPGAVDREKTIKRINLWARPLAGEEKPDSESFKLPDFLIGAQAKKDGGGLFEPLKEGYYKIEEPAFSYMVLGQYPAQSSTQLISRQWVDAARSRYDLYVAQYGEIPPKGVYPVEGLDVAEFGTDSNVLCDRYGGWVAPLAIWSGVDTIETGERAAKHHKEKRAVSTCADATGLGSGIAPHMQKLKCNAVGVKMSQSATEKAELGEFGNIRDQIWWACREWLRTDSGAMLPPDEKLLEELTTPRYEVKNGKIKVMNRDTIVELIKRSPDRATALALTFTPVLTEPLTEESVIISSESLTEGDTGLLRYPTDEERRADPRTKETSIYFQSTDEGEWTFFEKPNHRKEYILAVKTRGEATDEDKNYFNVMQIFDRGTDEKPILTQVAEYKAIGDIAIFSQEVIKAHLAIKSVIFPLTSKHDHGNTLINILKNQYPIYLRQQLDSLTHKYIEKFGWDLDINSKRQMLDAFLDALKQGKIIIRSQALANEIRTYGQPGSYNDLVLSAALAVQAELRTPRNSAYQIIETSVG